MRLLLTLAIISATVPAFAVADPVTPPDAVRVDPSRQRRVRTQDPRIRQALTDGAARSAAFRDVLGRVESRDVIVYVEMQLDLRGRLAGTMRWVAATREARYVRVALNPELSGNMLIATLGHELEHVAEVGETPSVVDEPTLASLYRDVGTEVRVGSGAWDTEAAQLTGEAVRRELAANSTADQQIALASRTRFERQ